MRAHGTRARYVFGVTGSNWRNGCRCADCSIAAGDYERNRRRQREAGTPAFVDATEAREHLHWLSTQGIGLRTVAEHTGLSRTALQKLRTGQRTRCRPETADLILGMHLGRAKPRAYVDGVDTLRRIEEIVAQGWTRKAIARRVVNPEAVSLQIGKNGRVTAETAVKVRDLHREVMAPVVARRERDAARQRASRERRRSAAA